MRFVALVTVLLISVPGGVVAAVGVVSSQGSIFYGGSVSASFGKVDYVELSPMVGTHITPRISAGASILYRYRNDERYGRRLTTNDWGTSLFARYRVMPSLYLESAYEYLDHEYISSGSDTARRQYYSFLAGGGMVTPLSAGSSMYMSVLYNLNYDDDESPYADPWVVRFGVAVGF